MMKDYRRFKFVKSMKLHDGTFRAGDEITVMGERVFYNGGMVEPSFYNLLLDIVEKEMKNGWDYLREVPIPYNKL